MGRKNVVENTMNLLFPQLCRGCGRRGEYLCGCCKNYIIERAFIHEFLDEDFGEGVSSKGVFDRLGWSGVRDEILGEMVEEYKYGPVRGMSYEIVEVVAEVMEKWVLREDEVARRESGRKKVSEVTGKKMNEGKSEGRGAMVKIILVPMATNRKHVRERGFDHMRKIAREIERWIGDVEKLEMIPLLKRAKDTVQVGASVAVRTKQAKEAVSVSERYLGEDGKFLEEIRQARIVLIDDVWTTGASMVEAGKILREAGARELWGLAITRNRAHRSPELKHGKF